MEQTIEQLQNLIMEKTIAYGLEDRAKILPASWRSSALTGQTKR